MQKGVCIDTGLSTILRKDSTYFLREHGKNNYYVSNFDNPKSYFGSFSKKYFRLTDEVRRSLRRFVARVSRSYNWYTLGDEYIITEKDHNGYFHVYLKNKPYKGPIGSYLNSFFEIIEPFNEAETAKALKSSQTDVLKVEMGGSTTVPDTSGKLKECVQLNLFDFIDS